MRKFGPYVVLGDLGSGGMGAVYRALDVRLERQVAVKVLHRDTAVSGPRERFLREARLVSSLNHPNICMIFDIGDEDGDPYLVMELLEGESLRDRMMRGTVPAEDIREIAFRVGLALQAAHGKGIVHRDIKPANIFLVQDGRGSMDVKVLDFGLAKLESNDRRMSMDGLTRAGATVGTVEYMSPEQACGESLDVRSDLFSLGAVLYEMATGVVPFHGATSAIVFSELLNRDPVTPRERNLGVPMDLDRLIRALLVKDRERRVQSAGDLLKMLSEGSTEYEARRVESMRRPRAVAPVATPLAAQGVVPVEPPLAASDTAGKAPTFIAGKPRPAGEARVVVPLAAKGEKPAMGDPEFGLRSRSGTAERRTEPRERNAPVLTEEERAAIRLAARGEGPQVGAGWKVALAAGVVVVVLVTLLVLLLLSRRPAATAHLDGALQVMPIANRTGDASLDQAPTVAMELLLAESPQFAVRRVAAADVLAGAGAAEATGEQVRMAAGFANAPRLGVLSGTLSHGAEGYVLALQVTDAATQAALTETEESVQSMAELPALLTRSATRLRMNLGEPVDAVQANAPVLAEEGSTVLPALVSFAEGESHAEAGDVLSAVGAYRRALNADARFQAAEIELAATMEAVHADAGAAAVLRVLQQQPAAGGAHLRCAREFALAEAGLVGDAGQVAERWRSERRQDTGALLATAAARMATGRYGDAADTGTEAARLDPFRRRCEGLLTEAQIAAGHADSAWQTQVQAYRLGVGSAGLSLAAAAMRGDGAGVEASRRNVVLEAGNPAAAVSEAVYLVGVGDLAGAERSFDRAERLAASSTELASAAVRVRAQAELARGLLGACDGVEGVLVQAWCGVWAGDAGGAEAEEGRLRDVALKWRNGDVRGALQSVESSRQPGTLAALVRGRLHALLGEPAAAMAAYEAVAGERGAAFLSGTPSYPVALAGMAGVYASTGDAANSARSAARLRELWDDRPAVTTLLMTMAHTPG